MRGSRTGLAKATRWLVRHEWESEAAIEEGIEEVPHHPIAWREQKDKDPMGIRLAKLEWCAGFSLGCLSWGVVFAHPFGRLLDQREPSCAENGTR